MAPTRLC
ncbi:hypothetical protein ECNE037_3293, partial [Escherichia coli NE037]